MRAGILVAVGGAAAILVATVPASAFNSGSDPATYYNRAVATIEAHRGWQGNEGVAFEPVGPFTQRLPDDEFDDILLNLVNWFRGENGLPELAQFEPLRVQSAIRSNQLADAGTSEVPDDWYASDAVAACNPLYDIYSTSAMSAGKPEDVFMEWAADPASRNAILSENPGAVGIATVSEGPHFYTTMRIADGTCPGDGLPFRQEPSGLPQPKLHAEPLPGGRGLAIQLHRRGDQQQVVEVQRAAAMGVWANWKDLFMQPGSHELRIHPPGGTYRVVVPKQNGYDVVFTDPIEVLGPPLPAG